MRRIEQDPEEIREEEEAISRAATPTHVGRTAVEFAEVHPHLGEFGIPFSQMQSLPDNVFLRKKLELRDPPELGWDLVEERE